MSWNLRQPRSPVPLLIGLWSLVCIALVGSCVTEMQDPEPHNAVDSLPLPELAGNSPTNPPQSYETLPDEEAALESATPADEALLPTDEFALDEDAHGPSGASGPKVRTPPPRAKIVLDYWCLAPRAAVRAAPAADGTQTHWLTRGERVRGSALLKHGWVALESGGYVAGHHLTLHKERLRKDQAQTPGGRWFTVKAPMLNVRSQPNRHAPANGILNRGHKVLVLREGWDGWSKIGSDRYLRSKHLEPSHKSH